MELYTLKDRVPTRAPSEAIWRHWKQENQSACEIERSYICGVMIVTKFIGYDLTGAGYLFTTIVKRDDGNCEQYGAKTWADAERNHGWMCKKVEDEQIVKARKAARSNHGTQH